MARDVTLVDAGLGNLASVERALIQVGGGVHVTNDPDKVAVSRTVVFPGQGAFGAATDDIVNGALGDALRMVMERGDPFLGICLGMQLLFTSSEEHGGHPALGVMDGVSTHFPKDMPAPGQTPEEAAGLHGTPRMLKVPHMGWNNVDPSGDHYYFIHSHYVKPAKAEDVMWECTYGDITFPAAVRRDNVLGCQFHPEKSQRAGLKFLRAFLLGGWT